MRSQWQQLENMVLPTQAELLEQAKKEAVLFPDQGEITQDWIGLSQVYQFLFGRFLLMQTGLDRLDERIAQLQIEPASQEQKTYYQKYDSIGLHYFYLRGCARVDRLSEEEKGALEKSRRVGSEESWEDALAFIEKTFRVVMTVNPQQPETIYEPKQTLYRSYQVKGKEIPFALRSVARFHSDGSLVSEEDEKKRIQVFTNIWKQVDRALTKDLGCPTRTAVEVFE